MTVKISDESEKSFEAALESEIEGTPSILIPVQDTALALNWFISSQSIVLELRKEMQKIAQEEAQRICAKQDGPSMLNAAIEASSDVFSVGFFEANIESKKYFLHFVEDVLLKKTT